MARLMADSPLLARYRVTYDGALAALRSAHLAGDTLLVARTTSVVGLAWLNSAPRLLNGAAYLRLLLVVPSAQYQGIGRRLLEAVELSARARGNHLYLLATTDNSAARGFYERHGYRHVGDLPGLIWPDIDEALYYKTLRAYAERLSG